MNRVLEKAVQKIQEEERKLRERREASCVSQPRYPQTRGYCQLRQCHVATRLSGPSASVDVLLGNLSLRASLRSDLLAADDAVCRDGCPNGDGDGAGLASAPRRPSGDGNDCGQSRLSVDYDREFEREPANKQVGLADWDPRAVEQPIENEEWVAFLQRSMEEVMDGEVGSLLQQNCVSVFVSPLRNPAAGCRVVEYVACLLSLPFVVPVGAECLDKIEQVYLDVRVVPNLVYAVKLLMSERPEDSSPPPTADTRPASTLSADELQALECVMLMLCRLVHVQEQFLTQFCDAVYIVNGMPLLRQLLSLEKRKARVVADLVAILNNVLRCQPENAELVERVVLRVKTPGNWQR